MSAIFISHSSKDNADAAAMGAWLEEQGHKSYFIDYDGIRAGTDWEQVLYQRMRQCHAVVALVSPDWIESRWCFSEMIQAREKGKPIFPIKVKPCELPGLLSDTQSIDLKANPADGYRRLGLGFKERGLEPTDAWDPERPPYPGLPSFQEADAAVFFGRSAEILELRETLEGLRRHNRDVQRFVLILGSSGSGKSSLVRHLMALATLRSDFLGTFQNQVALQEEGIRLGLNHVPWTVDPIPIERYADLIEGPARRAGLVLENNLVLKLVQDAGQLETAG